VTLLFYSFSSVFLFSLRLESMLPYWARNFPLHFFSFFFPARDRCGVGVCFVMSELLMDRVGGLDQSAVS